ncbi:hypothetical protein LO762_08950 [Actinocorallia sp. API 0066]|uniref:hypothetical protein n=1 Tax=Actinocorallia sp. API 0066 TaxID=2896846 RepID=UPI001E2A3AE7|nr:hypothetical protein [Actinocorallia sp. API 0066]MCD0449314.1 hypothetical protein [Actinocorallia sp. API 0066]
MPTEPPTGARKNGPVRRVRVIEILDDGDAPLDDAALTTALRAATDPDKDGDGATADHTPDAAPDEGETAARRGRFAAGWAGLRAAVPTSGRAVLVAALAVTTATAGVGLHQWRALAAEKSARQELVRRVADYGDAVGGFDYRDLQGSIDRSLSFLTGDALATQKEALVASRLEKEWTSKQLKLTSRTSAVYVTELNGDMAGAVLVFDINAESPLFEDSGPGPQPLLVRNHLTLGLVKRRGVWMVAAQSPAGNESTGTAVPGLTAADPPTEEP